MCGFTLHVAAASAAPMVRKVTHVNYTLFLKAPRILGLNYYIFVYTQMLHNVISITAICK